MDEFVITIVVFESLHEFSCLRPWLKVPSIKVKTVNDFHIESRLLESYGTIGIDVLLLPSLSWMEYPSNPFNVLKCIRVTNFSLTVYPSRYIKNKQIEFR